MFVVIWLFFAKRAAYKFVAPCIAWIVQRRSATQKLGLAIFLDMSWVSASSVTSWCIFNTTSKYVCAITFYSWKADVFIHRLLNNVYSRWIAINFPDNWKRTASTRQRFIQQVAGNPRCERFTIETPLQRERGLEIQREHRRRWARINISSGL